MRNLIVFLALFSAGYCQAQISTLNLGGATTKNYYVEVPYQFVHNEILVDIELGGKKHKFIFDTGAPTAINALLSRQLQAPTIGKEMLTDATGKADSVVFIQLNNIKIGGIVFSGIPALSGLPKLFDCFEIEGIIGSNLVRGSAVCFNTKTHRMIITDQLEKLALNEKHAIRMETSNEQSTPSFAIEFNDGITANIPFDTGSPTFFDINDENKVQLEPYKCFEVADKGYGASLISAFGLQPNADKYLLKFPFVKLGSARFENVYAKTHFNGNAASIGAAILNHGDIALDYINKKFYFAPADSVIDMAKKRWPFELTLKNDKIVVGVVWSAGKELLQPGEELLSVNGKKYASTCDYVNNGWAPMELPSVTLIIKDAKGKTRTVKINKI